MMQNIEAWRRLYDLADEVSQRAPWRFMEEQDIFAVQDPATGTRGYISVMGMGGEYIAVAVYIGEDGYYMFQDFSIEVSMGDFANPMSLVFIPQLQLSFGDKDVLSPEELALLKKLKRKYKKGQYPIFRRYDPGLFPWMISDEQVLFMTLMLEQLLEMAPRIEENVQILNPPEDFESSNIDLDVILLRTLEDGLWQEHFYEVPIAEDVPMTPQVDEAALQVVAALPKNKKHYEIGLQSLTEPVQPGEGVRPFFLLSFIVVDRKTELVDYSEVFEPTS